jgi:hypothetical protein
MGGHEVVQRKQAVVTDAQSGRTGLEFGRCRYGKGGEHLGPSPSICGIFCIIQQKCGSVKREVPSLRFLLG